VTIKSVISTTSSEVFDVNEDPMYGDLQSAFALSSSKPLVDPNDRKGP
jgi:hypothetical protein